MSPLVALLPSPLLGPVAWAPVASVLAARGFRVAQSPLLQRAPRTTGDVLAWYVDALPADEPVAVVPHSNAGLFVPSLTTRRPVTAAVFVDAGLPPRSGRFGVAPDGFYGFLEGLADAGGVLPIWSRWWGQEADELFPSADVRAQVEAEEHQLPLSYFAGSLSATTGWDDLPAAYLAFGNTYAQDRADAEARGWTASTMAGRHLHMLVDPTGVATEIERLLDSVVG